MNSNRGMFQIDWKTFGENIYGATDDDVKNRDVIVITLDSAIELRHLGILVYIIWMDGPIRQTRDRNVDVDNGDDLMKEVDLILVNDKTVSETAERLRTVKSSLTTICEAVDLT